MSIFGSLSALRFRILFVGVAKCNFRSDVTTLGEFYSCFSVLTVSQLLTRNIHSDVKGECGSESCDSYDLVFYTEAH